MINAGVNAKKLIDKGVCDKGFIWNPSNCECECDKSCDVREYLDYENYKCRKKLVDKLTQPCTFFLGGFCEISHNIFLKNPLDGCFCINTRSVYFPTTNFCLSEKDVTNKKRGNKSELNISNP